MSLFAISCWKELVENREMDDWKPAGDLAKLDDTFEVVGVNGVASRFWEQGLGGKGGREDVFAWKWNA